MPPLLELAKGKQDLVRERFNEQARKCVARIKGDMAVQMPIVREAAGRLNSPHGRRT